MNKQMSEVKELESLVSFLFLLPLPAPGQISLRKSLGTPRCLLSPGRPMAAGSTESLFLIYFQIQMSCKQGPPKYVSIKWNVLFHPFNVSVIAVKLVFIEKES